MRRGSFRGGRDDNQGRPQYVKKPRKDESPIPRRRDSRANSSQDRHHRQQAEYGNEERDNERRGRGRRDNRFAPPAPPPTTAPPSEELPIHAFREQILEHIRNNPVTCIQGETGCGKSTKVPQFILEDAIAEGRRKVNIAVTQPRRIACTALAKRVAFEINEEVGQSVGFRISGESTVSSTTKLTFMTTGYLLQVLISDPSALGNYSHVILDEVHERNVDADLLSLVVKLQSASMASRHSHTSFKIIVMSATLQGNLFSQYFAAGAAVPPTIFVGAKRFNVDTLYLDDLMRCSDGGRGDLLSSISKKSLLVPEILKKNGISEFRLDSVAERAVRSSCMKFERDEAKKAKKNSSAQPLEPAISEGLDFVVLNLIQHLAVPGESILVFFPGIGEITAAYGTLAQLESTGSMQPNRSQPNLRFDSQGPSRYAPVAPTFKIFVLHSVIPRSEQEEVFEEPAPDAVHVILASNVAESSLTLPKVRVVIDFCLRRQLIYAPKRHISSLVRVWASQSSSKQRLGRTGRVFPGVCIRLVTRSHYETCMEPFDPPEMLTAPLEKLYLQTKHLGYKLAQSFSPAAAATIGANLNQGVETMFTSSQLLEMSVQPPPTNSIQRAISSLHQIGALTDTSESAEITTLGRIAMHLPLDVRLSRLLYFSIAFGVPAEGVIIAACVTSADPFTLPSHLIIPSPVAYGEALQRSLYTRDHFDKKSYSEPLMCRNMFIEWLKYFERNLIAGRRGHSRNSRLEMSRSVQSFSVDHSVVPKRLVNLVSSAVEIGARLKRLLHPHLCRDALRAVDLLLNLMGGNVDESFGINSVLCDNPLFLKSLICISLAPQFLLGRPQVAFPASSTSVSLLADLQAPEANSGAFTVNGKSAEKRLKVLKAIASRGVDPSRTLLIPNLPRELSGDALISSLRLMCPNVQMDVKTTSEDGRVYTAIVSFPLKGSRHQPHQMNDWTDLPIEAHLLNQFGGARWKFPAPIPQNYQLLHANSLSDLDPEMDSDVSGTPIGSVRLGKVESAVDVRARDTEGSSPAKSALRRYNDFYKQDVMICQPHNPCLVKWKVLGFWMADELEELQAGRKKKPNSSTAIEVEGKCNYRNPIGFLATFPRSFRNSELTPSRAHELLFGVFVTQQGTDDPSSSRIEGVTLLPQAVALKLILACVRQTFDMNWVVQSHGIQGCRVTGLRLTHSRQELPVSLQIGNVGGDEASNATPPLLVQDLLQVNQFRKAFSAFLQEAERQASAAGAKIADFDKSTNRNARIPEADACVFVDKDVRLITALTDLLSSSPAKTPSPNELFELLGTESIGEFLEDMSPLSPESYGYCGQLLENKLKVMSAKKITATNTVSLFSAAPANSHFLHPVSIAGVVEATRNLRTELLKKRDPTPPAQRKKDKKQPAQQLKLVDQAKALGLSPPSHLAKRAKKQWIQAQLSKGSEPSQSSRAPSAQRSHRERGNQVVYHPNRQHDYPPQQRDYSQRRAYAEEPEQNWRSNWDSRAAYPYQGQHQMHSQHVNPQQGFYAPSGIYGRQVGRQAPETSDQMGFQDPYGYQQPGTLRYDAQSFQPGNAQSFQPGNYYG